MYDNIDDVVLWLRSNKIENWEVRGNDKEANSVIFETFDDEPMEAKINRFVENVSLYKHRNLCLIGYKSKSDKYNRKTIYFSTANAPTKATATAGVTGMVGIPEGYISQSEFRAIMDKELNQLRMEQMQRENDELKREIKELRTPTQEFIRKIAPVAPAIVSGLLGHRMPATIGSLDVATPNADTEAEELIHLSDEDNDRLISALKRWQDADGEFISLVEKIATLAENNLAMYDQAKMMLSNF